MGALTLAMPEMLKKWLKTMDRVIGRSEQDANKGSATISISISGEMFMLERGLPEVFSVSYGPMSMHSALVGTVSRMLSELCEEVWRAGLCMDEG